MTTMHERLHAARENAGFASAMAAAISFGWRTSTYAAHENGQNGFSVEVAQRYGRAFQVSAGWLLSGDGVSGMTRKLPKPRAATKSGHFRIRNPNCRIRNPISPVMQKVKGSLSGDKPAQMLAFLTDQPLSTCQKMLSGHRSENPQMIAALFRTHLIADVILAYTQGATDPRVKAVRKAVKLIKLEQQIARVAADEDDGDDA